MGIFGAVGVHMGGVGVLVGVALLLVVGVSVVVVGGVGGSGRERRSITTMYKKKHPLVLLQAHNRTSLQAPFGYSIKSISLVIKQPHMDFGKLPS